MKTVGLALGGGGVRGVAHALVLEALDEMGCRPSVIAGTSMGALIGALYASGLSGKTIKENILKSTISQQDTWEDIYNKRSDILKMVKSVALELGKGGLVKPDRFLNVLLGAMGKRTFADLALRLRIVAADYWKGEEVVLDSGNLLLAVKASIAIPGVFAPVTVGDRVLLDGGIVNLVPYEHVLNRCDISIAVNVSSIRAGDRRKMPNLWESVMGSFEILQSAVLAEKLKRRRPDIYVHPAIVDVPILAFSKAAQVLRQSAPAVRAMKSRLAKLLA